MQRIAINSGTRNRALVVFLGVALSVVGCRSSAATAACRTMADMRSWGIAVEGAAVEPNAYPPPCFVDTCRPANVYAPGTDRWGTSFRYMVSSDGRNFALISAGSDRVFAPFDIENISSMQAHVSAGTGDDLIFSNGTFLQYPPTCE